MNRTRECGSAVQNRSEDEIGRGGSPFSILGYAASGSRARAWDIMIALKEASLLLFFCASARAPLSFYISSLTRREERERRREMGARHGIFWLDMLNRCDRLNALLCWSARAGAFFNLILSIYTCNRILIVCIVLLRDFSDLNGVYRMSVLFKCEWLRNGWTLIRYR